MTKKLLIVGHPDISKSSFNKSMLEGVEEISNLTIHYIPQNYKYDIETDLEMISKFDKIIIQFPFIWYSAPVHLKQWLNDIISSITYKTTYSKENGKMKLILESNPNFKKQYSIEGKKIGLVITTAGASEYYKHDGFNEYTIEELARPFARMFRYCNAEYQTPFVHYSSKPQYLVDDKIKAEDLKAYVDFIKTF